MSTGKTKTLRFFIAAVIWWAAYAVMLASQAVDYHRMNGQYITWTFALKYGFGGTWTWIPMTMVCYCLALHHPIGKTNLGFALLANSLVVAGFIIAKGTYMYYTWDYFGWYDELPSFIEVLDTSLRVNMMMGWMVVGLTHGAVFYSKMEERGQRLSELSRNIISVKLEALRAQVSPHFLFNALNSVAELMHENLETADKMVVAISGTLRDSLSPEDQQVRSLRDEIEQLQNYLFIEKIRLGDRLKIMVDVDEEVLGLCIPVLTLQPIIENAIIHAIARSKTQGWLVIRAWRQADNLRVTVENSISLEGARKDGHGIGLKIVADRLALLYGEKAKISWGEVEDYCYRVSITVPILEGSSTREVRMNKVPA